MDTHIRIAKIITDLLDSRFGIGKFRIGLDPLIGLIPMFGDAITIVLSLYIIWIAIQLKLPQEKITLMVGNVLVDFFIGSFPFIGDIFDVFYKANSKNLKIIEEYRGRVVEGEVVE